MLYRLVLLWALVLLLPSTGNGQSVEKKESVDDRMTEKVMLLSDLHALEAKADQLGKAIPRALAMAEISDAAWALDQVWTKKLLREAYELTFPAEEERNKLRDKPVGAAPTVPTEIERARGVARNRVLAIASRDKTFADELAQLSARELGRQEESSRYSNLAAKSLAAGDKDAAGAYLLRSIEADPTQITASFGIINLAARDRKAADGLILQYLERLRAIPLSMANGSALRTYFSLRNIVFTNDSFDPRHRQIPSAGPAVIKAYINYVIESMSSLEQREPGSLQNLRGMLMSLWLPLKQYTPELAGPFLSLEKLSRSSGEVANLPQAGGEEESRTRYEERVKKALKSGQADDLTINFAIGRGDFDDARKMIDSLPEGEQKLRLTEVANTQEAISLTAKNDIQRAETLARQLTQATSILHVYTALIGKCVADKELSCATAMTYQAMKQLERAGDEAALPLSFSKLAKAVAPVDDALALELLDKVVLAANSSDADTEAGNVGLDVSIFKDLAPENELRVRQAATSLKDPLRQIVALAAIYQWKSGELMGKPKAVSKTPAVLK
jgi:hypothetical protein